MSNWYSARRKMAVILIAALIRAAPLAGQETLTLEQVYAVLRDRNPQLGAARGLAEAAAARQPGTALPADPVFQLGVMNLSLPSVRADMPSSMAPSVQLMQMVPFPGKLSLAGRIAGKTSAA